ncbi:VOC family protein [Arthrobacter psychrolactophilus]
MQRIVPNIWCQGNAAEVGKFYSDVLPQTSAETTMSYPTEGLPDFQLSFAGEPLVVDVMVGGYQLRLINAGAEFRPTPGISFILNMDPLMFDGGEDQARATIQDIWTAFCDGGQVRMELGVYPHSKLYGWVEDRFGVNWQLMLTDPAGEPRPFVIPQLLFTGPTAHAQEAMDLYTGLLPDSGTTMVRPSRWRIGWDYVRRIQARRAMVLRDGWGQRPRFHVYAGTVTGSFLRRSRRDRFSVGGLVQRSRGRTMWLGGGPLWCQLADRAGEYGRSHVAPGRLPTDAHDEKAHHRRALSPELQDTTLSYYEHRQARHYEST